MQDYDNNDYTVHPVEHTPSADMAPSLDEVLQTDYDEPHVIPVKLCEPTEVRELPAKRISTRTVAVIATAGSKLLSSDPRRKSAIVIARTQDIRIGSSQSESQLTGSWIPKTLILPVTSKGELWAMGDGAPTDVSVIEEYWA